MFNRLKIIRKSMDLTQQEFSEILGIKRAAYASYETGRVIPSLPFVRLICSKFNINEEWLLNGTEPMYNQLSSISFDEYAKQKNMTELEKNIIMDYLDLDEVTRKKVMEMLKNVFKKYLHKEDEQNAPIIRVPARGGYYEIEQTEERKAALRKDAENKYKYNPDDF